MSQPVDTFADMKDRVARDLRRFGKGRPCAWIDGEPVIHTRGQTPVPPAELFNRAVKLVEDIVLANYPGVPQHERRKCADMLTRALIQEDRLVLEVV